MEDPLARGAQGLLYYAWGGHDVGRPYMAAQKKDSVLRHSGTLMQLMQAGYFTALRARRAQRVKTVARSVTFSVKALPDLQHYKHPWQPGNNNTLS